MKRKYLIGFSILGLVLLCAAFAAGMRVGSAGYLRSAAFVQQSRIQMSRPGDGWAVSLGGSDTPDGRRYATSVFFDELRRTPSAVFGRDDPRLTAFQAAALARNAFDAQFPAYKHWDLAEVKLDFVTSEGVRYGYYEVHFEFFQFDERGGGWWTPQYHFYIAVLLDGTVIMPRPEEPQKQ